MIFIRKIDTLLEKLTTSVLVAAVLSMLFLSVFNIVLRWFNAHVMWIEPFVRYLVVLSAFLGGVIATGKKSHIGIDIVAKYFENKKMLKAHRVTRRLVDIICIVVLFFLVKSCLGFVESEAEYGRVVFLGIHAKYLAMILPIGFLLMGIRFLLSFFLSFESNDKGEP